jgi:pyruvate,water dikinase
MGSLSRRLAAWVQGLVAPTRALRERYESFKALLATDERCLLLIADLEDILAGVRVVGPERVRWLCAELTAEAGRMAGRLDDLRPGAHPGLAEALARIGAPLQEEFAARPLPEGLGDPLVLPLAEAAGRPELAGGKAANLSAAARAGARTPPGLVVTTAAFHRLMGQGRLRDRLDRLLRQVDLSRPERLKPLCAGMRALVLAAPLPPEVDEALRRAGSAPEFWGGRLAVRSSAVGEDGEASFAGQYRSLLDVAPGDLAQAWRQVAASKYAPRAVAYRARQGLEDRETPMAVLLLPMIEARASGVLHTSHRRPGGAAGTCMALFALDGRGEALVAGRVGSEPLLLARQIPPRALPGGVCAPVPEPALRELLLYGLILEPVLGGALEVEWAVDHGGRAFVLQARPLRQGGQPPAAEQVRPDGPVLAEGLSVVAPGLACGPVARLRPGEDPAGAPQGCVLVAETLSPALARCLDRVAAVAAHTGSRASHFGSLAREAGVPVVSGLAGPALALPGDLLVTVDADAGRILRGCPGGLRTPSPRPGPSPHPRLRERFQTLARLACRLTLTDPEAPEFSPEGCASLHDLVRFCHEKGVAAMAGLGGGDRPGRGMDRARRLSSPLPLALYVLDLGHGIAPEAPSGGDLAPDQLASRPMRALWSGLSHPGEPWGEEYNFDWGEFDRISGGIFRLDSRALGSLALVAEDYLHLLVRFGYHFAVVDSLCGPRAEANYLRFRFKGGGGTGRQRRLRLVFIAAVLHPLGFDLRQRGDILDARLARADGPATQQALTVLGRLLARTRRMDLGLQGEEQARELARGFLAECGCGMPGAEGCP